MATLLALPDRSSLHSEDGFWPLRVLRRSTFRAQPEPKKLSQYPVGGPPRAFQGLLAGTEIVSKRTGTAGRPRAGAVSWAGRGPRRPGPSPPGRAASGR